MGILARAFGWLWRRWADYQSGVAILDLLDLKTAVGAGVGFVAMTFFGATNEEWSAPGVVLAALIAAACVTIIIVLFRIFLASPPWRKANDPLSVSTASGADSVQIEFRWKPGGQSDPYEVNAIITAKQNLKGFVLIGHFAVAEHYLSSSRWLWQPSVRLLKTEDIFQGEVKSLAVIRCPRKDDGNSMMIFKRERGALKILSCFCSAWGRLAILEQPIFKKLTTLKGLAMLSS